MLGRGVIDWGQLLLVFSGLLVSCGWGMFGVSVGRGVDGFGSVLGVERLGVSMVGVVPRACMAGDGFHALHWNMFSWFGGCINVLRGFLFGWGRRDVVGGWILCLERFGVGWVLGEWVSRVGRSRSLGFFEGFCGSMDGGGWLWLWLLVWVEGLLRVVIVVGGGAGGVVSLGVGWV